MRADFDAQAFSDEVVNELCALWGKLPEWQSSGPYADHLQPLDPLGRRERERLARLRHWEGQRERTRERVARERNRSWREQDYWGLRKRVWQERRDQERELLERRERALLEREQELLDQTERQDRWLLALLALEPSAAAWCAEQVALRDVWGLTPDLLQAVLQRLIIAAHRRADMLLRSDSLQQPLSTALRGCKRDPFAVARAVTPLLLGQAQELALQPIAALFAALVIALSRSKDNRDDTNKGASVTL
jgi:hypothetical protein